MPDQQVSGRVFFEQVIRDNLDLGRPDRVQLPIRHGADVRFAKTSRVLADLAGGHADGTWGRRLRELAQPAVLILDDFGMRELTARQATTSTS